MEYKDYYKILGVDRKAGMEDVKRAYRKLAMQYHPDRNPGDKKAEERFKEINEAYQVLSDPQKRAHYDRLGDSYSRWQRSSAPGDFNWSDWFAQPAGGTRVVYGDLDELFGAGAFSDFFRTIFSGMGGLGDFPTTSGRGRSRAAPAYQQPVTISLQEAYSGTTRQVRTNGRRIEVKLPSGARTGTKVRVPEVGPAGPGGQPSDLYLIVDVAADPRFERDGNDLRTRITIDAFTAMLGGEVEVQTMTGNVILTIPPGTQPEQVFRIAGRGMPQLKNPQVRGDLYVRVKVQIPRTLSAKQKNLLKEAARQK